MITLNVYYKFNSNEERQAFLNALYEGGIVDGSRSEDGNLRYDYFFPEKGDTEMLLIEQWRDEEALAAHNETPHFKKIPDIKAGFSVETRLERYETK